MRKIRSLSGYKGVYPVRNKDGLIISWAAQWNKIHLGCFESKEKASEEYDKKILKEMGEFAATNEIIKRSNDVKKSLG